MIYAGVFLAGVVVGAAAMLLITALAVREDIE